MPWTVMGLRAAYATGIGYLVVCAGALVLRAAVAPSAAAMAPGTATHVPNASQPRAGAQADSSAAAWFTGVKPYCNALEVETRLRASPPPAGLEGAGYRAACLALAGKMKAAEHTIDALPDRDQWRAASVVFEVGHPVADQGDDQSAGPIMRLVLRYWPNNYMALYHAGMSEYVLGQQAQGKAHLEEFLRLYQVDDSFTRRAKAVLAGRRPLPGAHE